jgi:hypothetical protein
MPEDPNNLAWSAWLPLEGCWRGSVVPTKNGLYRIRRCGVERLEYIGETGIGLRERLAMLKRVYDHAMPYRDPHTAAPALWALRHKLACVFEASVTMVEGPGTWRKGLEAAAIALYRQEYGESPTSNFGRIIAGYIISSGNNAKLVTAGRRFRGGPSPETTENHNPSVPPVDRVTGNPVASNWCGHRWSNWTDAANIARSLSRSEFGLYRLRARGSNRLVYIGEGRIAARIATHLRKARHPTGAQSRVFAAADGLECSYVVGDDWAQNQRLELETDLIGAYVLSLRDVPPAQFVARKKTAAK